MYLERPSLAPARLLIINYCGFARTSAEGARPPEPNCNWIKNGVTRRLAPKIKLRPWILVELVLACEILFFFRVRTEGWEEAPGTRRRRGLLCVHLHSRRLNLINVCAALEKPKLRRAGTRAKNWRRRQVRALCHLTLNNKAVVSWWQYDVNMQIY